jgi:nucleoside-diphosphate-sugar epimerase
MRVFVTGASGVIGSRVVPALLAAGHEVTAAVRSVGRGADLQRQGAIIRPVNLFAPTDVRAAVAGHQVVLNLATHIPSSFALFVPGGWRENDRIRRVASANLVDAALESGVQRFVQESFAPIYLDQGDDWVDESSPVKPVRYNRTVLDAEAAAQRFTSSGGVGVVLRFASFYGPDSDQLAAMIAFVRRGWMPLPGPARSYFASVSHDDAAAAVVAALELPPGIYNVGDDEPLRHREYADALAGALGVRPPHLPPAWAALLAGSVGRLYARSVRLSNRRLRVESGWFPRYRSAREGLAAVAGGLGRIASAEGAEQRR